MGKSWEEASSKNMEDTSSKEKMLLRPWEDASSKEMEEL